MSPHHSLTTSHLAFSTMLPLFVDRFWRYLPVCHLEFDTDSIYVSTGVKMPSIRATVVLVFLILEWDSILLYYFIIQIYTYNCLDLIWKIIVYFCFVNNQVLLFSGWSYLNQKSIKTKPYHTKDDNTAAMLSAWLKL